MESFIIGGCLFILIVALVRWAAYQLYPISSN